MIGSLRKVLQRRRRTFAGLQSQSNPNRTHRWVVVDINALPREQAYRPDTEKWAARVNWRRVNRVVTQLFEAERLDDYEAVDRASRWMLRRNRLAVDSLLSWPIDADSVQITNGIHRIAAMRMQGVQFTIGADFAR